MPLQKTEKIWHKGKLIRWEDANIHVMSHVIHYGSSVFEGVRCYKTAPGPATYAIVSPEIPTSSTAVRSGVTTRPPATTRSIIRGAAAGRVAPTSRSARGGQTWCAQTAFGLATFAPSFFVDTATRE